MEISNSNQGNIFENEINIDEEYKEEKASEAYDIMLNLRDKEVDEFSSKANLFIVTQAAILAFAGTNITDAIPSSDWGDIFTISIFCALGFILSFICHRMLQGASFWIEYCQTRLGVLEPSKLKNIHIFSDHPSSNNNHPSVRLSSSTLVKKNQIKLKYISTRSAIMSISVSFLILWALIFLLSLITFGIQQW